LELPVADVLARIDDWPVGAAAVGVTGPDAALATHGPVDEPFRFASVTKLLTAYAVLIAIQDGMLHLDEPAGPDGATVRHLLAHASGLPFSPGGPTSEPGARRVYSNLGYEVLGELVASRVGTTFAEHLDLEVFQPLGMSSTVLEGSPAAGGRGTVSDLLAFARELLRPTLLEEDLHREATTVDFPGLDGVLPGHGRQTPNDWGLGFELKGDKSPHWTGATHSTSTYGHFGQSGSFLWVDPERELACAFLTDRDYGAWAAEVWPDFNDAVLEAFGP
jgi:CubicO group peptidase (beta-lactamase class C family)